jgi:uncharacterized protein (TIGR00251 family)
MSKQKNWKEFFFQVKVTPNSSKTKMKKWTDEQLEIALKSIPEKGKANDELIAFLSELIGIPKSRIEIIHGETSRTKRIKVLLDEETIAEFLKKRFTV